MYAGLSDKRWDDLYFAIVSSDRTREGMVREFGEEAVAFAEVHPVVLAALRYKKSATTREP